MRLLVTLLPLGLFACTGGLPASNTILPGTLDSTLDSAELGGTSGTSGDRYHPDGYDNPDVHGRDLEIGVDDCRACHGDQLDGGDSSCDTCHRAGWRTDCTYCHGGQASTSGAPPRGLLRDTPRSVFGAHAAPLAAARPPAWDCGVCHTKPTGALSAGHIFDATPGVAEVAFTGLAAGATWNGAGTCGNVYCHGNGAGAAGSYSDDRGPTQCNSCHPTNALGGEHRRHDQVDCAGCHADTVTGANSISGPTKHVDGHVDVAVTESLFWINNSGCTGFCHGKGHFSERW